MYRQAILLLFIVVGLWSCSSQLDQEISCSSLQISLKSKTDPISCSPAEGQIRVFAQGGQSPYFFRLNNSSIAQRDSVFNSLQGGTYIIEVIDAFECENSVEVTLSNFNTDLAGTVKTFPDTDCLAGNGTASFIASGGVPPYQLKFQNAIVGSSLELTGLKHGLYQASVIDSQLCEFVLAVNVPRGVTSTSWSLDIKPIIDMRCAKPLCHVDGTGRSDLSKFENVQQLAAQIKEKTQNRSMPFDEPMPTTEIQLIACWVDSGALDN